MKKERKKDKKDKKEKKEKLDLQGTEIQIEENIETKKSDILSKLDRLDDISIAKSREIEEKLRKSLIDSQLTEKREEPNQNKISISEIKNKIEELRHLKQKYYVQGENHKSLEIAKKIIDIANMGNLKLIIHEEMKFIELIQAKTSPIKPISEQIEELKKKRHTYYTQEKYNEAVKIAEIIIELADEANLIQTKKTEENFINLMQEKIDRKRKNADIIEPIKHSNDVKQKQIEGTLIKENAKEKTEVIEINKFNEEKLKFEEEKEKFRQMKLEFEEERRIFLQEKQKFEEERDTFKWEKQMFEEAKKFERDKYSS